MQVKEFFNTDFVDYASYTTLRAICSIMDGQKNSGRKILKTVIDKNITTEIKVSQLASKMAEYTEYLHGDASGSIVTMAQDYTGSNNIALLYPEGNFGTRFKNEASAPRYIYTHASKDLFNIFNKDDKDILDKQYFEGYEIEPKFYVPSLPILLINGNDQMATGFKQVLLPRSQDEITKYLKYNLEGKNKSNKPFQNKPHYNGFNGVVRQGDEKHKWEICGVINRKSASKVEITELPIGFELKKYIQVLNKLEDEGFIQSYTDKSDNNTFHFELQFKIADLKSLTDEKLMAKLKLIRKESELYIAIDENNQVKKFKNVNDMFWHYYNVKITYLQKRKDFLIDKITNDIHLDVSKYLFIKMIVDDKLIINKRKKVDIEKDLDNVEKIITRDGNYNYLLNLSIGTLTKEKMDALMKEIKDKKAELDLVKSQTVEAMWLKDLS